MFEYIVLIGLAALVIAQLEYYLCRWIYQLRPIEPINWFIACSQPAVYWNIDDPSKYEHIRIMMDTASSENANPVSVEVEFK